MSVVEEKKLASDEEREAVISRLNAACERGRFSVEVLDERVGKALEAQYGSDLERLVEDLPDPLTFHMRPEDYRYTWTLSSKAWYVRLYLAVWWADADEVTFCKLFWGYLLMLPIGVPLNVVCVPFRVMGALGRKLGKAIAATPEPPPPRPVKARKPARPPELTTPSHPTAGRIARFYASRVRDNSRVYWRFGDGSVTDVSLGLATIRHRFPAAGEYEVTMWASDKDGKEHEVAKTIRVHERPRVPVRVLEGAELWGAKGVAGLSSLSRPVRKPIQVAASAAVRPVGAGTGKALSVGFGSYRRTLISLGVLYAAVVAAGVVVSGVNVSPHAIVQAFRSPNFHIAGGALLLFGIAVLAMFSIAAVTIFACFFRTGVPQAFGEVLREGTKKGGVTFLEALRVGYVSVKSNTCPRVVVEEEDE